MKRTPALIVIVLLVMPVLLLNHYSSDSFSDEPVVLHKAVPPNIVMFGTQSCKYCAIARAFFDKNQLPYIEHDIEASDKNQQLFYLMGGKGTPLIIVNGEIIHGFEEQAIRDNL